MRRPSTSVSSSDHPRLGIAVCGDQRTREGSEPAFRLRDGLQARFECGVSDRDRRALWAGRDVYLRVELLC